MINLMLTGRAAANVFNGDIECNKSGRKLVNKKLHSVFLFFVVAFFDMTTKSQCPSVIKLDSPRRIKENRWIELGGAVG